MWGNLKKYYFFLVLFVVLGAFWSINKSLAHGAGIDSSLEQFPTLATSKVKAGNFSFLADQFLVTYKNDTALKLYTASSSNVRFSRKNISDKTYLISDRQNQTASQIFIKKSKQDTNISNIIPNYLAFLQSTPNDPRFSEQWAWKAAKSNVEQAWDITATRDLHEVLVAVIDSGIDYRHEDFPVDRLWDGTSCKSSTGAALGNCKYGYDLINGDNDPMANGTDEDTHGTNVSSVIAAKINNVKGMAGIAPNAKIMSIKVFEGEITSVDKIIDAYNFAFYNEAKIINGSIGISEITAPITPLEEAIQRLNDKGVLIVSAAGNENSNNDTTPILPCNYKKTNTICVAATTENDKMASFSNFGTQFIDISAPGEGILVAEYLNNQSEYNLWSGTSFSSPFVAGEAALIWGYNYGFTATQVKEIILSTGDAITDTKKIAVNSRVNVYKAMQKAQTMVGNTPTVTVPSDSAVPSPTVTTIVPTLTLTPPYVSPTTPV
ncbi:MAG: S8 family serine peptidase, partial [bacterium]